VVEDAISLRELASSREIAEICLEER